MKKYDFAGYVTKNDVRCMDGLTIKQGAFSGNEAMEVPLVWQHQHNSPSNVLGKVRLENRPDGVYGYGTFNESRSAEDARAAVKHGDVTAMSIFARRVKKRGMDVVHGVIQEVSLVLAGANPGALIDFVDVAHADDENAEREVIFQGGELIHTADQVEEILHELKEKEEEEKLQNGNKKPTTEEPEVEHSAGRTVGQVYSEFTDEQRSAVSMLVEEALATNLSGGETVKQSEGDIEDMKKNIFDGKETENLTHSFDVNAFRDDLTSNKGTLKELMFAHGIGNAGLEGLDAIYHGGLTTAEGTIAHAGTGGTDLGLMFPEAKTTQHMPQHIGLTNTAYEQILNGVAKVPFQRVKNLVADWTKEEARAKGYITGDQKDDIAFELMSRETHSQTVFIRSKYDRDDVIDVEEFDLINYTSANMMIKLKEELARAIFIGDGRQSSDKRKIKEDKIRPILKDDNFYTIKKTIPTVADIVERVIKDKAEYRGSGSPYMFIQPELLADLKLLKDATGKYIFGNIPSEAELASILGVKGFIETTFFGKTRGMVMVNLSDYVVGAAKGGQITSFEDFDIDFNKLTNLIETRCSGALITPKSAIYWTVGEATKQSVDVNVKENVTAPAGK